MGSGVIYCFLNRINNKRYIGQTINFNRRMKQHFIDSKKNIYKSALHDAINKYGKKNFDVFILQEIKCSTIQDLCISLNKTEKYYIKKYNTFGIDGYNLTKGGEGCLGIVVSEETKKKMSKIHKGKIPWNKGLNKDIDKRVKKYGEKGSKTKKGRIPWNKGVSMSKEQKIKLSEIRKKLYQEGKLPDMSGENNPMYGKSSWNKNKKGIQTAWNKGKKMSNAYKESIKQGWIKRKLKEQAA